MANNSAVTIKGLEQLQAVLKELPLVVQNKVARAGVNIAGSRLRTMMRRRVPVVSGRLRKSISMRYITTDKGNPQVRVGLLTNQFYSTLDNGRKAYSRVYRKNRVGGNTKGDKFPVAGSPRMNTTGTGIMGAWNDHKQEILDLMVTRMTTEMYKELGKMSVRGIHRKGR